MELREALGKLDSMNDDHWTADGSPKIDAVSELFGQKVTRQEIIDAAPKFSRSNTDLEEPKKEEPPVSDDFKEAITKIATSEPLGEGEFYQMLNKIPTDGLSVVERVLLEQSAAVEVQIKDANDMKARLKLCLVAVRGRIKTERPDMDNQQAIREYLESQQALREAKTETTREILKGIDLKTLDPRAAIDRAFARKRQRGTQRPKVV